MDINNLRNSLKIDCQKCHGLCCTALYFSQLDGFPENKKAGCKCSFLKKDYQCSIYELLEERQYKGCITYDCFGGGQIISSKRDCQNNVVSYNAFIVLIQVMQMYAYLIDAYQLFPTKQIMSLIKENESIQKSNLTDIASFGLQNYHERVSILLKSICDEYPRYQPTMKNSKHRFLDNIDLSMQIRIGDDFKQCTFKNSIFLGTDLRGVDFCGADLSESLFLTQIQLNSTKGNQKTKIPKWLTRPRTWRIK